MLKGTTAFVSGGSGAVGSAIVRVMVREGCRVAFSYHNHAEAAEGLAAETGARGYLLDVTNGRACAETAHKIENDIEPVDILVNNAGIAQVSRSPSSKKKTGTA